MKYQIHLSTIYFNIFTFIHVYIYNKLFVSNSDQRWYGYLSEKAISVPLFAIVSVS